MAFLPWHRSGASRVVLFRIIVINIFVQLGDFTRSEADVHTQYAGWLTWRSSLQVPAAVACNINFVWSMLVGSQ